MDTEPSSEWYFYLHSWCRHVSKLVCWHVQGLTESFVSGSKQWRPLYDSPEPHKMQLPHGLHLLPAFKKLLILRCIRYISCTSCLHPK
jgi:hypothetical protein